MQFQHRAEGLRTHRFWPTVLLSQPFLSVVARFDAGRWLFDDPTCSGTCLSIWPLVRAFYSAACVSRLNLLATFGACVGEAACDDTTSDSKLLAAMPGRLHFSRLYGAVDCHMAIWTFIFQPFVCTFFATASAHGHIFLSMATFFFVDSWSFRGLGWTVFLRWEHAPSSGPQRTNWQVRSSCDFSVWTTYNKWANT